MPEIQSNTLTFPRDFFGPRVEDTAAQTLFWYGADGTLLGMTDPAGPGDVEWIYFAGRRISKFVMGYAGPWGAAFYDDANGSLLLETDGYGNTNCRANYYPFGDPVGSGCQPYENIQFAGLYSDAAGEDGGDSATQRRYSATYYRWFSPDPAGMAAVNLSDPQTWNMYSYALDNPTTLSDPLGLFEAVPIGCTIDATGMGYTCPSGDDGDSTDFSFGFVNPIPSPFLPGGNGTGAYLIHVNVTAAPPSGPVPSYGQVLKSFNNCAANFADRYSVASLLGRLPFVRNGPILNAALGSTTAAVSNLVFQTDPKIYVPAGASLAAGANAGAALKAGAVAAGAIQVNPGFRSIFTTINPTTLAETAAGSTALNGAKGLAGLLDLAAPALIGYDELLYGIGEGVCAAPGF